MMSAFCQEASGQAQGKGSNSRAEKGQSRGTV